MQDGVWILFLLSKIWRNRPNYQRALTYCIFRTCRVFQRILFNVLMFSLHFDTWRAKTVVFILRAVSFPIHIIGEDFCILEFPVLVAVFQNTRCHFLIDTCSMFLTIPVQEKVIFKHLVPKYYVIVLCTCTVGFLGEHEVVNQWTAMFVLNLGFFCHGVNQMFSSNNPGEHLAAERGSFKKSWLTLPGLYDKFWNENRNGRMTKERQDKVQMCLYKNKNEIVTFHGKTCTKA